MHDAQSGRKEGAVSKLPYLPPSLVAMLLVIAFGALPMAAQEQQELTHGGGRIDYAYVRFDFNAENKRAPRKVRTVHVLPRGTGIWDWCLYGFNTANKAGSFKYLLESYDALADSPFVVGSRFFLERGSVKVESRESTAYGDTCFTLTFGSVYDTAIHTVTVTTKSTRKQPRGSFSEWGLWATPVQENEAVLDPKVLSANVPIDVPSGALPFPD